MKNRARISITLGSILRYCLLGIELRRNARLADGRHYYRGASGTLPAEAFWRDLVRDERMKSFLWTKAIRRELVPVPLFDESLAVMSDFEAMWRLFHLVRTVEYIHAPLYIYRQREGSIVNQPRPDRMMMMFRLALKRMGEVEDSCRADALSCAMYHAYHYCHMAAKFSSPSWVAEGQLDECRVFIRRHQERHGAGCRRRRSGGHWRRRR